jgi:hypothetical protein
MVERIGGAKSGHLFRQVKCKKAQQLLAGLLSFQILKRITSFLNYFLAAGAVTTAAIASV